MLVFGVKTGFGRLICRAWVNQARKKRSKTFENIQKYSNFEYKRSKIFEKIQRINGNW